MSKIYFPISDVRNDYLRYEAKKADRNNDNCISFDEFNSYSEKINNAKKYGMCSEEDYIQAMDLMKDDEIIQKENHIKSIKNQIVFNDIKIERYKNLLETEKFDYSEYASNSNKKSYKVKWAGLFGAVTSAAALVMIGLSAKYGKETLSLATNIGKVFAGSAGLGVVSVGAVIGAKSYENAQNKKPETKEMIKNFYIESIDKLEKQNETLKEELSVYEAEK